MAFQSELTPPPAAPNLSFNPGANIDTAPAQIALQQQNQQQQINQQAISSVQKTAEQASGLVQSFVQAAQQRQRMNAVQTLASLYSRSAEPSLRPGTQIGPQPEPIPGPVQQSGTLYQPPSVPFGQTPQFRAQQLAALMRIDPQKVADEQTQQLFKPVNLDQQYQNQLFSRMNPNDPNALGSAYDQYESIKRGANTVLSGRQVEGKTIPDFEFNKLTKTGTYLDGTPVPPDVLAKAIKGSSTSQGFQTERDKNNFLERQQKEFLRDPEIQATNKTLDAVKEARDMVNGNIPAAQFNTKVMMAKMSGLNRITQAEIMNESGDPSFFARLGQRAETIRQGKATQANIDQFNQMIGIIEKAAQGNLQDAVNSRSDSAYAIHPEIGKDKITKVLGSSVQHHLPSSIGGNPQPGQKLTPQQEADAFMRGF